VYSCLPYDSKNKQRLFRKTALVGWSFVKERQRVLCEVGTEFLNPLLITFQAPTLTDTTTGEDYGTGTL
jgi:hypothetical protein